MTENESYDFNVRIPSGYSRTRAISHLVRELDDFYASGPTATLPDTGSEEHEDPDVRADASIASGVDEGAPDVDSGRASSEGDSDAPTERDGGGSDEESTPGSVDTSESTVRSDEQQASDERVQPEVEESARQSGAIVFSYPPGLSR